MGFALTPFRFEHEMVKPLLPLLPTVFELNSGQRARVLRETAIGSVIPDLMIGVWSGDLPCYSKLNGVSRHILAWLSTEKAARDEEQLRDALLLSKPAADSAVSALQRIGAIEKKDSGEIELRREFDISHLVRLIAIEIKLKRWRQALAQAAEYRRFADEAYVVLDGAQLEAGAEISEAFLAHGVGLLLQRGGELSKEIPAESATPIPSVGRLMAVTKLGTSGPYCLA
jgi:hypothetical protein